MTKNRARLAILAMAAVLLAGCKDTYRYYCQNPDNFYAEQCQKPKCQFTQTCPEYLVAPIMEKQTNVPAAPAPAPEAPANR